VEYIDGDVPGIQSEVEYELTEIPEAGYELLSISCEDGDGLPVGEAGVFVAEPSQDIACTLTNDDVNLATFSVTKTFDDGNPGSVEVTISCNTGLPLSQSKDISAVAGVTFVVTDFENGAMDCDITETAGAEGYATEYFDGTSPSAEGCFHENVTLGDDLVCEINNSLSPVDIQVTKSWIDDKQQFQTPYVAEATYACANEQFGNAQGELFFDGNPDTESFSVFPHWDGTTTCTVIESLFEGGVEPDDSACEGLLVTPGSGASCEIINLRLYEGIPTLSRHGLVISAMLMLLIGLVFVRRGL
jgi:hypothetical protein